MSTAFGWVAAVPPVKSVSAIKLPLPVPPESMLTLGFTMVPSTHDFNGVDFCIVRRAVGEGNHDLPCCAGGCRVGFQDRFVLGAVAA